MLLVTYPFVRQKNMRDCGIAALSMIAAYHDRKVEASRLRELTRIDRVGTSFTSLINAGAYYGLIGEGVMLASMEDLEKIPADRPAILLVNNNHFVVFYGRHGNRYVLGDPASGVVRLKEDQLAAKFMTKRLAPDAPPVGYALLFEPGEVPEHQDAPATEPVKDKNQVRKEVLQPHLRHLRAFLPVILLGIVTVSAVQYLLPFFTKMIVDLGIGAGDLSFVKFLLFGQLVFILSKTFFNIVRGWLVLHLSLRINFQLISSFLNKLFALPIPFFESRRVGDILQRINDHHRIESFLTKNALSVLISALTVVVYSFVLLNFHQLFFGLFMGATAVYAVWIIYFLKARKKIDVKRFEYAAIDQSLILQIINGMHDLKISNGQGFFHQKWKENKEDSFENTADSLRVNQIQDTGTMLIIEIAQLSILFLSASLIINNQITLGTLLSIQFIIGQLVSPMEQIVQGIIRGQEALISLDRITEFWSAKEEAAYGEGVQLPAGQLAITLDKVNFSHAGQFGKPTLRNVSLEIPAGKSTAIVGASGSGKTTLLKLLLGYYQHYEGQVKIGEDTFRSLALDQWRRRCGVILQESFIFNESIKRNITLGDDFDEDTFRMAVDITNLGEFVESMPNKYDTPVGRDGKGLSMGQKQRILMARAIYKNPEYVFMDEATNSLDAGNETLIMDALQHFFRGRTVIIVAHRLSTIQFADNIIVLHQGEVAEQGSHEELLQRKGRYYKLVNQQLQIPSHDN